MDVTKTSASEPCPPQAEVADSILPLRLRDISYRVGGETLLAGITAVFRPGSRTILLGPNGAGKSLLLRICHGLLPPSSGEVIWQTGDASQVRRQQAMVFQQPLMLRRSVRANVNYALARRGVPRRLRRDPASAALRRVGLDSLAGAPARVLSAGEQQRLALARAWALQPQVLFLDEPTANLDPAGVRAVEAIIGEVHREGTAIVMTTHDLEQARRMADEVLFLHRGRLLEQQPADSFFAAPRSPEASAFLRGNLMW